MNAPTIPDTETLMAIRARLDFVQARLDAGDTSGARAALSRIISILPAPHERHIMAARAIARE